MSGHAQEVIKHQGGQIFNSDRKEKHNLLCLWLWYQILTRLILNWLCKQLLYNVTLTGGGYGDNLCLKEQ